MKYSVIAFIISLFVHSLLVAAYFSINTTKEKKEIIVLNMNMIDKIIETKKVEKAEQKINTKDEKKSVERIEKKPLIKKEKKIVKKTLEKEKIKEEQKEELKKIVKSKEIEKKPIIKKEEDSIKRVKNGENYQEKYIKSNLSKIIAAIKKHKKYPYLAKKMQMEGKVIIKCIITSKGEIRNIDFVEKSSFEILNKNSIEILKKASKEFEAPKKEIELTIPFNYELT
ncbi:energy transducer TonB [Halarcobacter ebronensis]|uniref:TonB C-terminal domain-containing protein n=1 Tax=Halarcobacter ebronensis TaxID=1462615 RepID=A0A4V1M0M3_9BACT|nr:energy transducer TonB [Halarcobacter ebronensis]QKF82774.1 energy transduction protein TonB [Halarcobacter ebronensis]RXK06798.1 hypothetical protein CRV07_05040 [Halarcobacter ebronensis]